MKICLLRGPSVLIINSTAMRSSQPLGLAYIAGALSRAGHELYVIDAIAESPDTFYHFHKELYTNGLSIDEIISRIEPDTDVVGISCMFSFNWLSDRHIIDTIHKHFPHIKIVAGGEHITSLPEHSITTTTGLNVCVLGEGEETIVEVMDAIQNQTDLNDVDGIVYRDPEGNAIKTKRRHRIKNLDEIAMPYWDIFPMEKYFDNKLYYGVDFEGRTLPIVATRGCPFQCTFCSSPDMWGTRYYMRDPASVVNEIRYYKEKFNINNVDFFDLTAIIKKQWIIDFCKLLIENDLNITWQIPAGTRSEAIDKEVASYLYKSGCTFITYAPESGSKEILKIIKKKVNLDNMLESMKACSQEGMNIKLNIIIGFPEESHQSIWQTLLLHIKTSFAGANDMSPAVFHPYPGSFYFNQLLEQGKINIETDQYYLDLIYVNYLGKIRSFAVNVSPLMIKFYVLLNVITFYASNFLFRPFRLFKLVRNVLKNRVESRMELHIRAILNRNKGEFRHQEVVKPKIRL